MMCRQCFSRSHRGFDLLIALLIFMFGVVLGQQYLSALNTGRSAIRSIDSLYGPAIMLAYGEGFVSPDWYAYPELNAFLRSERDTFPRELLPETVIERESSVAAYHRYLLYTVAFFWRLFGVSWTSLEPMLALMLGCCAATVYALMRLGMGRLMSVIMTLVFITSPTVLYVIPDLRDFSKGPFILAILMIQGWIIKKERSIRVLSLLGCLLALLAGIGMGFRQDVLVFAPPSAVILLIAGWRITNTAMVRRCVPLLIFLLCFLVVSWPMLGRMESSAGPDHHIVQGFCRKHLGNLGVFSPLYEPLASRNDYYAFAVVYDQARRMGGEQAEHFGMDSPGHEAAARQWLLDTAFHFPADLLVRGYAALVRILQYMSAYPPIGTISYPWSWTETSLSAHQTLAGHLHIFGLLYAVLTLLLIAVHSVPLALGLLVFLLYACGYVSLQFEYRHGFHLGFIPFWILGFLLSTTWRTGRRLLIHRQRVLSCRTIVARMGLTACCAMLMLVAPLGILRLWQHQTVGKLLAAYEAPELLPLSVQPEARHGWTQFLIEQPDCHEELHLPEFFDDDLTALYACIAALLRSEAREGHTRTRYMAAVFNDAPADTPLLVLYTSAIPWNNFTQLLALGGVPDSGGQVTYFFPVHELFMREDGPAARSCFVGLAVPDDTTSLFQGLYEVKDISPFRFLMHVTKAGSYQQWPRYLRLAFFQDPTSYNRPEIGSVELLGRAQTLRALGHDDDALQLLHAVLLPSMDNEHRLHVASLLKTLGDLDTAMEVVLESIETSYVSDEQAIALLLEIGLEWREQGQPKQAAIALEAAGRRIPKGSVSALAIGDYYASMGADTEAFARYVDYMRHNPESEEALARINVHLDKKGSEEYAIATWREIAASNPEAVLPRIQLGYYLDKAGDQRSAAAVLQDALDNAPHYVEARLRLAALYATLNEQERSWPLLESALHDAPGQRAYAITLMIEAARKLSSSDAHEQVVNLCQHLLDHYEIDNPRKFEVARILEDAGAYESARDIYTELIATAQMREQAASALDYLLRTRESIVNRIETWRVLHSSYPEEKILQAYLVAGLFDGGKFEDVLEHTAHPDSLEGDTIVRKGISEMAVGDVTLGGMLIDNYVENHADKKDAVAAMSSPAIEMLIQREKWDRALALARKIVALAPEKEEGWLKTGQILEAMMLDTDALHLYEDAVATSYAYWQVGIRMDALFRRLYAAGEQLERWRALAERYPDSIVIRRYLALALDESEMPDEAVQLYRDILPEVLDQHVIQIRLGGALAASGNLDEGLAYMADAVANAPELSYLAAEACLKAYVMRQKISAHDEAVILLQELLVYRPDDYDARLRMGEVLQQSGKIEESMDIYQWIIHHVDDVETVRQAVSHLDMTLRKETPAQRSSTWQEIMELSPEKGLAAERCIVALMEAGQFAEALTICTHNETSDMKPVSISLLCMALECRLGDCAIDIEVAGRNTLGQADIPDDVIEIIFETAKDLFDERETPKAERLFLLAEMLQPDNLWHQLWLGRVAAAHERYEEALERFRRILTVVPDSPQTAAQMDLVYDLLNDHEARVQEWRALADRHPESLILREHLEKALDKQNNSSGDTQ